MDRPTPDLHALPNRRAVTAAIGAVSAVSAVSAFPAISAFPAVSAISAISAGLATASLGGCATVAASLAATPGVQMNQVYDDGGCPRTLAPVLLVLLPGIHMPLAELQQQGFIRALRQQGLAVDMILADTNIGYVNDRSVMRRLHDEVIAPARAQGYRRIWLAGISLGGFLALQHVRLHPGQIDGVFLLAPYLGRAQLIQDLRAAGPAAWLRNNPGPRDADDVDHALWTWLAQGLSGAVAATEPLPSQTPRTPQTPLPSALPPIWLGYGRDDRFVQAHTLLAGLLPPERVRTAPGGHDWPPWRSLWAQWLASGVLPPASSACT